MKTATTHLICSLLFLIFAAYSENLSAQTQSTKKQSEQTPSSSWDKYLDEYEALCDEYIAAFKKAMKGDLNAMNEYPKLLERSQKLQAALDEAKEKGSLTPAQNKRFAKIAQKFLRSSQELYQTPK